MLAHTQQLWAALTTQGGRDEGINGLGWRALKGPGRALKGVKHDFQTESAFCWFWENQASAWSLANKNNTLSSRKKFCWPKKKVNAPLFQWCHTVPGGGGNPPGTSRKNSNISATTWWNSIRFDSKWSYGPVLSKYEQIIILWFLNFDVRVRNVARGSQIRGKNCLQTHVGSWLDLQSTTEYEHNHSQVREHYESHSVRNW